MITRELIRGRLKGQSQRRHDDGSKEVRGRERERLEDAVFLALKMGEGTTGQGMWAASGS